ncbi:MAG: methyltransferase type 11 [Kangiellaceae bacterium]|nr:methyltransferase type 11 [Kangiellaceae bacterium]|tara:strand:+ start:1126 stop:2169 length:1044 start_codon:yes stop_codon:yes gene_type:complete
MHESVQEYYGQTLSSSDDLQTNACCTGSEPPQYLKNILSKLHDDVMSRYFGCGIICPTALEGMRILDLGCGAGRDVYALSALVGPSGSVVGVDMTDEQLEVANRHIEYHRQAFGFPEANVSFYKGYIEKLDELPLEPQSFDIIVSNCVINLAVDKAAVLKAARELLKPGGEMYFSDVYVDRRMPESLKSDPVLYGECLAGALYWNDFVNLAKQSGFLDPRLVEDAPITIENQQIIEKTEGLRFFSATYRLFNIDKLEPACEDYGQAVIYKGDISNQKASFLLDKHHLIETGKVFPVCGNTYRMLNESRFNSHFEFIGSWDKHYGIFEGCGTSLPFDSEQVAGEGGCC